MDVKICVYDTNDQPKRETFKYEQYKIFLGVAKDEIKEYGTITMKRCLVFDHTNIFFHNRKLKTMNRKRICNNT